MVYMNLVEDKNGYLKWVLAVVEMDLLEICDRFTFDMGHCFKEAAIQSHSGKWYFECVG